MEILFTDITPTPNVFFNILPPDWQHSIVSFWKEYAPSSKIYTLKRGNEILGGGIVFSQPTPDVAHYKKEAHDLFEKGYLYIAFLWMAPSQRDKGLGSLWMKELFKKHPLQKFWLSIEDYSLSAFYKKNNFTLYKEITTNPAPEWIMLHEV
ncbi:GNAT family N-acetyltransferase [Abyssalbus ytuae]|uniref:GNAT family N-acetyltransferase n=1 Tax=Abyssalbus ytuae TaxID=2926907 RepID=A0A9E7CTW9_9FLAO|nr:GNAT family N-acetyltransferase [Abyssalbus ytuae]UOB17007.1 GNAT family N-acetyltransferase [Abyssalbus ytuae]